MWRWWAVLAVMWLAASAPAASDEPVRAVVLDARLGEHPDYTRFVVELSDQVDARAFHLTDPDRIVVDLPALDWKLTDPGRPSGKGLVKAYRYGVFRAGRARIVIDLKSPALAQELRWLTPEGDKGFRLVVDLRPVAREAFAAGAGWPQETAVPTQTASLPLAGPVDPAAPLTQGLPVIVIDAGHGGIDPGAIGASGLSEKEVTLAIAQTLRDRLQATGRYQIVTTRDDDTFLSLSERVAIARAAQADLFVSLHADSIDKPGVRGASVYTLSEKASDAEAEALAAKENAVDVLAGINIAGETPEVTSILVDLAQRETKGHAERFAAAVVTELGNRTQLVERPHRTAGFRVLRAPDVPAALVELGFLSNKDDEQSLASAEWRGRIAEGLQAAIDAHFAKPPGVTPASFP